ncbi:MAG: hypothetical protein ABSB35_28615 [Bryobacteraceae bacterium]
MPPKSYDPGLIPVDPVLGDCKCPRCGVETEPIDVEVEGLPVQDLELCPGCYLVIWRDRDGLHVRQGVPMKAGIDPRDESAWMDGEPKKC